MSREVRRVPLVWDWPLRKVWEGYLTPERLQGKRCPDCERGETHFGHWLSSLCYLISMLGSDVHDQRRGSRLHPWLADSGRSHGHFEYRLDDQWVHAHDVARDDQPRLRSAASRYVIDRPSGDALRFFQGILKRHNDIRAAAGDEYSYLYEDRELPPVEKVASTLGSGSDSTGAGNVHRALIDVLADAAGVDLTCTTCNGEGALEEYTGQFAERDAWTPHEPPEGDGWQLWETVSEGSPVSPVFATADGLAQWLTTPEGGRASGPSKQPMTISQARAFVAAGHSVGSLVQNAGGVHDGAHFAGSEAILCEYEKD